MLFPLAPGTTQNTWERQLTLRSCPDLRHLKVKHHKTYLWGSWAPRTKSRTLCWTPGQLTEYMGRLRHLITGSRIAHKQYSSMLRMQLPRTGQWEMWRTEASLKPHTLGVALTAAGGTWIKGSNSSEARDQNSGFPQILMRGCPNN